MKYKYYKVDQFIKAVLLTILFPLSLLSQDYIWPTSASKLLTSSFGEYRPRRYHAGFDVKTWGKEGYPVFAMKDGYVWRVRVSPNGYGKVMYVKHRDGYYTVYAHLSQFAEPIRSLVRKRQLETASYVQEFYFKPDQFPVRQGDTIAFTGSTGIGYPHLHFEIRDPYHKPINPGLFLNQYLQDNIAPRPLYLAFVPESYMTKIDGEHEIQVYEVVRRKKNTYELPGLIQLTGPFYLSLKVIDFMKGGFNRFNIFKIDLKIDGRVVESIQLDTLNYSYNHHSQLYFDYLLERSGFRRFQTLKKHHAFKLPFYKKDLWDDYLKSLSSGLHEGFIQLTDIKGNISTLKFQFYYKPPTLHLTMKEKRDSIIYILNSPYEIKSIRLNHYFKHSPLKVKDIPTVETHQRKSKGIISIPKNELEGYIGSSIVVKTANQLNYHLFPIYRIPQKYDSSVFLSDLTDMPTWMVLKLQAREFIPDLAVDDQARPYVLLERKAIDKYDVIIEKKFFLSGDTLHLYGPDEEKLFSFYQPLVKVLPGQHQIIKESHNRFFVEFPEGALYDTNYVQLATLSGEILPYDENYPLQDRIYKISPFSIRSAEPFKVYLPYKPGNEQKHIFPVYFDQRKGRWFYLPATVSNDSSWYVCPVYSAEYFSLARDTIPPEIRIVYLPKSGRKKKEIRCIIQDQFAGIDKIDQIVVKINGKKHFFEWDPEENLVVVPDWAMPEIIHKVEIEAVDNAGNRNRINFYNK